MDIHWGIQIIRYYSDLTKGFCNCLFLTMMVVVDLKSGNKQVQLSRVFL